MKKILKITGITFLIVLLILIATPFVFQSQIKDMVRNFINQNVNAKVEFADVNLSFISSFPKANVTVDDLKITTLSPFKDETLANATSFSFDMSIKELFKKTEDAPIKINNITLNEALISLKTNTLGDSNWHIAKEKEAENTTPETTKGFSLDIQDYAINNSAFTYIDEKANTKIHVIALNHKGHGTFSETVSKLDTKTEANVTLSIDSTQYLNNTNIKLDALIDLDLEQNKYTFNENKGFVNNLPLEFNGFVQNLENGKNIDVSFNNPGSDFKDFLAVIPAEYSKNLDGIKTAGNFKINGLIKGLSSKETIPNIAINIVSNNASFKYPDLPKSIENISINASVKNTTGKVDDTFLDIETLNFKIDEDVFKSSATIKHLTGNQSVNANIDGVLNLENITKAYPIELDKNLIGIVKAKLNTHFDMNAIETNAYERIKNNGDITVSDFEFSSVDIVNPIKISEADINFKPGIVTLENFKATSGQTDLDATGTINNLLGFLLSDKKLKGNFNVNANNFLVSDFMTEGGSDRPVNQSTKPDDTLKIPAFLDCVINADAKTVVYDNLTLTNVKGTLEIADEKANFKKITSDLFEGNLTMSGLVDTKSKTPIFDMNLGMENFDISQSFNDLDMLKNLAPIADALQGKLNSNIKLSGSLGDDFTPLLSSISGNALAELLTTKIEPKNTDLFDALTSKINFIDFDKLDLKDLKTTLKFDDGKVNISPFNLQYKDIGITIGGSHSFDKTMNYNMVLDVPAKYLGSEVNTLINKINDAEVNNIKVPIIANLTGSFTKPNVTTDLTNGVKNLTTQLIEIQKQKLLNDGKDKLNDVINDVLGGSKQETDSTSTETNNPVKDILGGILGGNTKPKDSTKTDGSTTKNPIKDVLGGIFGKKKKKKDTIN